MKVSALDNSKFTTEQGALLIIKNKAFNKLPKLSDETINTVDRNLWEFT